MPLNSKNIRQLKNWLGSEGAIAGLEESNLTVSELYDLAKSLNGSVDKKTTRIEIIIEIVNLDIKIIKKSNDDLLSMKCGEIKSYLESNQVSRTEITNMLFKFGILPSSEDRRKLVNFAAREISDLGMYERVAKGRKRD